MLGGRDSYGKSQERTPFNARPCASLGCTWPAAPANFRLTRVQGILLTDRTPLYDLSAQAIEGWV